MMPGISGLETLQKIKEILPAIPRGYGDQELKENIMDQAIGQKIADYLIKPVNPNLILHTLENIHRKEIVTEVTQNSYQHNFQDIAMQISDCKSYEDWIEVYKRTVHWELELSSTDSNMTEMLKMQKRKPTSDLPNISRTIICDGLPLNRTRYLRQEIICKG